MPYEGEFASYSPLRRVAASERVQSLLSQYAIRQGTAQVEPPTFTDATTLRYDGWIADWVIALDGSYLPVPLVNGYPGAEAAYITTASVLLDMKLVRQLNPQRPVDPVLVRRTEEADTVDCALPGCNVMLGAEQSAEGSFRRAFFDVLAGSRMAGAQESLLDTYEMLLGYKPSNRTERCPYDDCRDPNEAYLRGQGNYSCPCPLARPLYSTDALRLTERMNPGGSNGELYGEVLQVLERLWVVHILRAFLDNGWTRSLGHVAVIIDGPLALFGHPAWLSHAIEPELARINAKVVSLTGRDLLLLGIQKQGVFVDHFALIDEDASGHDSRIAPGTFFLLDDGYIKRHIVPSQSTKPHGRDTYFGRTFFYKTARNSRVVGMLPYLDPSHRDVQVALTEQYPRLADALHLLDELVSSRFENAVSALVSANAAAAIPLSIGRQVLERLARELMGTATTTP